MTFNIRYDASSDGENRWIYRKDAVSGVFSKFDIDIAGLQEALFNQVKDLGERLPDYNWYGAGRDDGKNEGEFSVIFYKKDKLKLIRGDTFWLSEYPDSSGSVGWDAAITRICTWGEFMDINSGKTFFYFNTHLDHIGETAREKSTELILSKIKIIALGAPVILTGDFNLNRSSVPYKYITSNNIFPLQDAQFVKGVKNSGPDWTFHGFDSVEESKREKIDFIFINSGISVIRHSILNYKLDGKYPSDHLPVAAEVILR